MKRTLFVALVALVGSPLLAGEEKTWEGTWNNKKFNTTGPLKCVATAGEGGQWTATFSGTFRGAPFSYDVSFQAKPGRNQSDLSGTATIKGDKYDWTGSLKGATLTGSYRSSGGYFGEFVLKERKTK